MCIRDSDEAVTAAVTASSLSANTPASSMPPRKQRATTLPSGTRYENLVPTQVQATRRFRSFLGTRNPKPEGSLSKSASFVYPVSYTHLTLPTILRVYMSVG